MFSVIRNAVGDPSRMFSPVSKPFPPPAASDEWTAYTSDVPQGLALVWLEPACLDTLGDWLPSLHSHHHTHAFPSTPNMWPVADWHEDPRAWPFNLMVRSDTVRWYLNYKLSPKFGPVATPLLSPSASLFCFASPTDTHKLSWESLPIKHMQPYIPMSWSSFR